MSPQLFKSIDSYHLLRLSNNFDLQIHPLLLSIIIIIIILQTHSSILSLNYIIYSTIIIHHET